MKKHFLAALVTLSVFHLAQSSALAACPGNCNGHGTCNPDDTCSCFAGYVGMACDQCGPNYYNYPTCTFCQSAATCSGNGFCTATGSCTCNVGFTGPACSQCAPNYYNYPTCTFCLASSSCSGNGTCTATGSCNCNAGWSGPACNQPAAVPTVSEWGLAVLTVAGLFAGAILFTRRNKTASA